jgi:hypothetical protein
MADGKYADHGADGKVTASGTWSVVDGKTCFDPEGDGGGHLLYRNRSRRGWQVHRHTRRGRSRDGQEDRLIQVEFNGEKLK